VGRVAFKKGATPLDGSHAFAFPSCITSFHLPSPRMGSARVAFVLLSLEEILRPCRRPRPGWIPPKVESTPRVLLPPPIDV
jgi:hypothetical protein